MRGMCRTGKPLDLKWTKLIDNESSSTAGLAVSRRNESNTDVLLVPVVSTLLFRSSDGAQGSYNS